MELETLFGDGGALAAVDPRYEPRPQQRRLAEAVAEILEGGGELVAEAGTGVGKSLGYLLPAGLWAAAGGRRVIVSTYTRALQEQLMEKELPLAARALERAGLSLRYAMLQGADNYLCVGRLSRLAQNPSLFGGGYEALVGRLSAWAASAESGHRSRLPELVPQPLWSRIARDPDLCAGPGGRFWGACLWRRDRERAERAQILVVNHALLLSGARLPPADALIIDEAHSLEDAAASHFGLTVSRARLARLLEDCRSLSRRVSGLSEAAEDCAREGDAFFAALLAAHGLADADEGEARLLAEEAALPAWPALRGLERALLEASAGAGSEEEAELRLLQGRAAQLRGDLAHILSERSEDVARWVERAPSGAALRAEPLELGGRLAESLFGRGLPVVLTSATLGAGHGLRGFKRSVGLPAARELALDSPFDYPTQAGLLVMDDLPEPSESAAYVSALARRCAEIVARVPGGVFLLFSSWRALRAVHQRLRRKIKDRPLWMQASSGNEALLAEFAAAGNAVLLGVDTFWHGVDVPGSALSAVVLAKLPFPAFGAPVEEARRRYYESMGRGYFESYSLPKAVMKFRQGFGRLIRSSTDRGAVIVLDSRLARRGYGRAFLDSLPRCRELRSLEELASFFSSAIPPR